MPRNYYWIEGTTVYGSHLPLWILPLPHGVQNGKIWSKKSEFLRGGFTFFKKSVKNHHFRQILVRKFKNSSFLTAVVVAFFKKKFKTIILAKNCPEFCKITIFLRWIFVKKVSQKYHFTTNLIRKCSKVDFKITKKISWTLFSQRSFP